jgi:capsular polysaccharide biosynthesis protein
MLDLPACDWLERHVLETPASFSSSADLVLGDGLRNPERRGFAGRTMTGQAENWWMRKVTLFPALGLIFKDGHAIDATRYCVFPGEELVALKCLAGRHRRLEGKRVFVGLNRVCGNYFHTLTQIIPAVAGYESDPAFGEGTLLLNAPTPALLQGLQLAGVDLPEVITVDPAVPIDIDDLAFSSLLSDPSLLSPFSLSVFDRMLERAAAAGPVTACAKPLIYIWRADSSARPMLNEDELVERLVRAWGVEPVVLSLLSLNEQIAVFRNARVVVGPHGAGLANVVFCSSAAVLYELLPSHYLNPCINQLAQLRGLHYWCDVHDAQSQPGLWRHQVPWTVDIDLVERRLEAILSRVAQARA